MSYNSYNGDELGRLIFDNGDFFAYHSLCHTMTSLDITELIICLAFVLLKHCYDFFEFLE